MASQTFPVIPAREIDPVLLDAELKAAVTSIVGVSYLSSNGLTSQVEITSPSALSSGEQTTVTATIEGFSLTHPNLERIEYPPFYVSTSNNTPTVLFQKNLPNFRAFGISLFLIAVTANGLIKRWRVDFTIKRLGNGSAQVGATTVLALHADTGMTTAGEYVITGAAVSNGVTITVTGSNTSSHQPVQWAGLADIVRYSG